MPQNYKEASEPLFVPIKNCSCEHSLSFIITFFLWTKKPALKSEKEYNFNYDA